MAVARFQRCSLLLLGLWGHGALAKMVMGIADGEDYQLVSTFCFRFPPATPGRCYHDLAGDGAVGIMANKPSASVATAPLPPPVTVSASGDGDDDPRYGPSQGQIVPNGHIHSQTIVSADGHKFLVVNHSDVLQGLSCDQLVKRAKVIEPLVEKTKEVVAYDLTLNVIGSAPHQ
eukprot:s1680_g4.t1